MLKLCLHRCTIHAPTHYINYKRIQKPKMNLSCFEYINFAKVLSFMKIQKIIKAYNLKANIYCNRCMNILLNP